MSDKFNNSIYVNLHTIVYDDDDDDSSGTSIPSIVLFVFIEKPQETLFPLTLYNFSLLISLYISLYHILG